MMNLSIWKCTYKEPTRRAHKHRCRACWKVIEVGTPVIQCRPNGGRRTWTIHEACADKQHCPASERHAATTWLWAFEQWSGGKLQEARAA